MILLWGLPEDPPLAAAWRTLQAFGCPCAFVNQRLADRSGFESTFDGRGLRGRITMLNAEIPLEAVDAIYARPSNVSKLPHFKERDVSMTDAIRFEAAMLMLCEVSKAKVLNRPSAMASNSSKPYQCGLIAALGLRIPDTVVTTDPREALAFIECHGKAIYKSVSSERSIVATLTASDLDRIGEIEACPTQFQAHVPGIDYRVHVVDEEVIATKIISSADDYRYDPYASLSPHALPPDVEAACIAVARGLELPFCGIDLRLTPAGDWVCFEVNPSPGYTYYDRDGAIARAVASSLIRGNRELVET